MYLKHVNQALKNVILVFKIYYSSIRNMLKCIENIDHVLKNVEHVFKKNQTCI